MGLSDNSGDNINDYGDKCLAPSHPWQICIPQTRNGTMGPSSNHKKSVTMTQIKSRLFELTSSLTSTHALVSMPEKSWGWLDKLVTDKYPKAGYQGLINAAAANGCTKTLTKDLRRKAQESYEKQMDRLYDLANDNTPKEGYGDLKRNPSMPTAAPSSTILPRPRSSP